MSDWEEAGGDEWGDADGDQGDWGNEAEDPNADWGEEDPNGGWGGGDPGDGEEEPIGPELEIENLMTDLELSWKDDPDAAIEIFSDLLGKLDIQINEGKKEYIETKFTSITFMLKIYLNRNEREEFLKLFQQLLDLGSDVAPSTVSETVTDILDRSARCEDEKLLEDCFSLSLDSLKKIDTSLWFQNAMRLANLRLNRGEYKECSDLVEECHASCRLKDGNDDPKKAGQLLEIYALQMQQATMLGKVENLKALYKVTSSLAADIKDPRSQSVIKECWAKMYADEGKWKRAYAEFWEAFVMYQEVSRSKAAIRCLRYAIITNLISGSDANPFNTREAQACMNKKPIQAVVSLQTAYENDDIREFEGVLAKNKDLTSDVFIKKHLESLMIEIRSKSIIKIVRPYNRIRINYLAGHLNVTPEFVLSLLVKLILDGKLKGRIDQVQGILNLKRNTSEANENAKRYKALDEWTINVQKLNDRITNATAANQYLASSMGRPDVLGMGGMSLLFQQFFPGM